MQFTVPQFLDVEDKIIGPITARQFLICMGGGLLLFIAYKLLSFDSFIIAALIIGASTGILAFFRVNGMPFHLFLLNLIQTFKRSKLRVWIKEYTYAELRLLAIKKPEFKPGVNIPTKRLSPVSSLSELSLIVDTGGVYKGEEGYQPE